MEQLVAGTGLGTASVAIDGNNNRWTPYINLYKPETAVYPYFPEPFQLNRSREKACLVLMSVPQYVEFNPTILLGRVLGVAVNGRCP
jgi:hypothetical protein